MKRGGALARSSRTDRGCVLRQNADGVGEGVEDETGFAHVTLVGILYGAEQTVADRARHTNSIDVGLVGRAPVGIFGAGAIDGALGSGSGLGNALMASQVVYYEAFLADLAFVLVF